MRTGEREGRERGEFKVRGSKLSELRTRNFGHRTARSIAFAFSLSFFVLTCSVVFSSPGQASEIPTEAVRSTLTEVFRILEDEKLKDPAKLIPRRHMLEEVIASRFDYTEMSKRALAANWIPLTADRKTHV